MRKPKKEKSAYAEARTPRVKRDRRTDDEQRVQLPHERAAIFMRKAESAAARGDLAAADKWSRICNRILDDARTLNDMDQAAESEDVEAIRRELFERLQQHAPADQLTLIQDRLKLDSSLFREGVTPEQIVEFVWGGGFPQYDDCKTLP